MTEKQFIFLATLCSGLLLLGALAFQYVAGLPPCKLCYLQRYPHVIVLLFGSIYYFTLITKIAIIPATASFASSGIGAYHFGIEQKFWPGPNTCSSVSVNNLSTDDLIEQIMTASIIKCDEVLWSFLSISMAGWNSIFSTFLGLFWMAILIKFNKKNLLKQ